MQPLPDITQIMQLARSPAGQQLFAMLQRSDSNALQEAVRRVSAGDFDGAKQLLTGLLSDKESQELLRKLEEQS